MSFTEQCLVNIHNRNGGQLNVTHLVGQQLTENDEMVLEFWNELGQSHTIIFKANKELQLNRDATGRPVYCNLEGIGDGERSSLSVCSSSLFGGIITIGGERYVLDTRKDGSFVMLPQSTHSCEWKSRKKRLSKRSNNAYYYAEYLDRKWRYVELALIADRLVFEKYDSDVDVVVQRLHAIANHINTLYEPLNIRVALVWADVWSKDNLVEVTSNSDTTLNNFLKFRKSLMKDHPHDNAHLLTGVHFDNNIVGKAFKGTMCSYDYSGGVDMDHSKQVAFVAATIAHEMGHNFGMEHDYSDAECKCPGRSCIMSPSTGAVPPTFWSECSLRTIKHSFNRGLDYCLHNRPESVFGGARCGNGLVEANEECDCGTESACTNKCCNPSTCKLVAGAKCATGECCDVETCQMKPATTECRQSSNQCDLSEYCDGQMEHCPADFFVQDGHRCPNSPDDYCYDGFCGSRDDQCRFIWGETGSNAASECYDLNVYGTSGGNCGFQYETERFIPCDKSNVKCGRLHCIHENEKLAFGDPSTVFTAYTGVHLHDRSAVACRVAWTKYVGGRKVPDPGMVPDGAVCGKDRMCVNTKCVNRTETVLMAPKCDSESCNGVGICNNMGNCHCEISYGGTTCAIPGPGGSVNSGPASTENGAHAGLITFWLLIFLALAFICASIVVKRRKNIWLHKQIWKKLRTVLQIERLLVPIRKAPPPPGPTIRTADLNALWGEASVQGQQNPAPVFFPSKKMTYGLAASEAPMPPERPNMEALSALYAEKSHEIHGSKYSEPSKNSYCPLPTEISAPKISRSESVRPNEPPPPPPHANVKPTQKFGAGHDSKPHIPHKPPNVKLTSVKDIAAKFESKSDGVASEFI